MVNKLNIKVIALAVGLAFSAGGMAQSMSKADYNAGKDRIAAKYKAAKAGCASLSGNSNDICLTEADGSQNIARAELEASYKPSSKTRHAARIAKTDADYAVAKERCDDMAGNPKDVCVKQAMAADTAAKADAKVQMETADANATASEKSAAAFSKADNKTADARKDAAMVNLDAQYEVAKEKCDVYAGGAKDYCLERAKALFGKS
jgi:hypothetical protein